MLPAKKRRFVRVRCLGRQAHGLLRGAEGGRLPTLHATFFQGRERCGNRLSYSNIDDEQQTQLASPLVRGNGRESGPPLCSFSR